MPRYEYKVVPAPKKAGKIKGLKGTDQRFAGALASLMNQYGADGWEYQRTDTLPCEERHGLTGRATVFQNMLIFRREASAMPDISAPVETTEPEPAPAVPLFRTTTSAPATDAAQGRAPHLGTATPPEPADPAPAPSIAAQ